MSEPLFLQSVMQEKIWGGTHLRDVLATTFQATMSESTGLFLLTQMVFLLLRMVVMPVKL